jgi:hypothetical protein
LRAGDEEAIREARGPAEAAKKAITRITGLSEGTLGKELRNAALLPVIRVALGRWITRDERERYIREICATEAARIPGQLGPLSSFHELDSVTGVELDLFVEQLTKELVTTKAGWNSLLLNEFDDPSIRAIQDKFRERWCLTYGLIRLLAKTLPEQAEHLFSDATTFKEGIRSAVRALIDAHHRTNENAVGDCEQRLGLAVWNDLIGSLCDHHAKDLGPLAGNVE